MTMRRIVIGLGVALAVIAPLVVAAMFSLSLENFWKFYVQQGWDARLLPGISAFVFGSRGVFVSGLSFISLTAFGVWLYLFWRHRTHLLVGTLMITVCSLHISLLSLGLLLMAVSLPVIARLPMCP